MHYDLNDNTAYLNSQEVKFSDTLSVPTSDGIHKIQYVLTGYVLYIGDTDKGHYKVVCKGGNDLWFLYNDQNALLLLNETIIYINVK